MLYLSDCFFAGFSILVTTTLALIVAFIMGAIKSKEEKRLIRFLPLSFKIVAAFSFLHLIILILSGCGKEIFHNATLIFVYSVGGFIVSYICALLGGAGAEVFRIIFKR